MARRNDRSHDYAMQFIVYSLAVFFGVYFAQIIVKFLEKMDFIALFIGAILGALGLFISAKIIMNGIDLKK